MGPSRLDIWNMAITDYIVSKSNNNRRHHICWSCNGKNQVCSSSKSWCNHHPSRQTCFREGGRWSRLQDTLFCSDGSIYTSKSFWLDLQNHNPRLHLLGIGAKHQNGVAENGVNTVSNLALAMLIHAVLRWHASHNLILWPLCLKHAIYIWNRIPSKIDGLSPQEKWTGTKSDHHELRCLHPWGCPVYVIKPTWQDRRKLLKWKPKRGQGKFVGLSPLSASNVALILNRKTTRISAQFHILFNDFLRLWKESTWQKVQTWIVSTGQTSSKHTERKSFLTIQTRDTAPSAPQPRREIVSLHDRRTATSSRDTKNSDASSPAEHSLLSEDRRESPKSK